MVGPTPQVTTESEGAACGRGNAQAAAWATVWSSEGASLRAALYPTLGRGSQAQSLGWGVAVEGEVCWGCVWGLRRAAGPGRSKPAGMMSLFLC